MNLEERIQQLENGENTLEVERLINQSSDRRVILWDQTFANALRYGGACRDLLGRAGQRQW